MTSFLPVKRRFAILLLLQSSLWVASAVPGMGAPPGHREWAWDGGDRLASDIPASVTVRYAPGGPARMELNGPEDLLSHVKFSGGAITAQGGNLSIRNEKFEAVIHGVVPKRYVLSGSGHLLLGTLQQDTLNLDISGSGSISAEGSVNALKVDISRSGKANLGKMKALRADVSISSSGTARIAPKDYANLTISSSGKIHLQGRPINLVQNISGSGKIMIEDGNGRVVETIGWPRR